MRNILLLMAFSVFGLSSTLSAQSFGHINTAELLNQMSEMKSAEKELETYSKQLDNQYKQKVTDFETYYKKILEDVQAGILSPKEQANKEKEVQERQNEIGKFELEAQQKIGQKRDQLLAPILEKAKLAIESVAKENGYSYVFDTSVGSVLYSPPADDIMARVKAKLGM